MQANKILPGLSSLARYDRSQWWCDSLAALVVTLVLIPSAFAYADLAKCAPAAGFYVSVANADFVIQSLSMRMPFQLSTSPQPSNYVARLRERGIELIVASAPLPLRQTAFAFGTIHP